MTTKKIKNIKDFKPADVGGDIIHVDDAIRRVIGNSIYFTSGDIAVCKEALKLYNGEDFEVIEGMADAVQRSQGIAAWLKLQFCEWLEK